MVNSQQVVVYYPTFEGLKIPANSMMVIEFLVQLATFDLVPTQHLESMIYYFPETDPYSVNFEMAGYESLYFLANIGFAMYLIYLLIFVVLLHILLRTVRGQS